MSDTTLFLIILSWFSIFPLVVKMSSKDCQGNAATDGESERYGQSYDETWKQSKLLANTEKSRYLRLCLHRHSQQP